MSYKQAGKFDRLAAQNGKSAKQFLLDLLNDKKTPYLAAASVGMYENTIRNQIKRLEIISVRQPDGSILWVEQPEDEIIQEGCLVTA